MNHSISGKRILITRAENQAGDFVRQLSEYGAEVLVFPTIATVEPSSWVALDQAIEQLKSFDWIFFTSANGVEFFWKRLQYHNLNAQTLTDLRVCAIGKATAAALSAVKIEVNLIPREFKAEGVLECFLEACGGREHVVGKRVLLPRARVAREVLPEELSKLGVEIEVVEAYQTIRPQTDIHRWRQELLAGQIDVVTFTSASTVNHFAEMFPEDDLRTLLNSVAIACIGPVTTEAALKRGLTVAIQPGEYTIPALTAEIVKFFQKAGSAGILPA